MSTWIELDVHVPKNSTDEDILKIVKILRPEWMNVKTKHLEGGKANQTVTCRNDDDVTTDETIIIRIRHQTEEEILFNYKNEIPVIKKSSEAGLCGKIIATLKNGTVLQYLPGRVLNWDDLENPHILKLCAETIADFHSLLWNPGDLPNASTQTELEILSKQPKMISRIKEAIEHIPDNPSPTLNKLLQTELWAKSDLTAEVEFIAQLMEKLNLPVCLAHNDVQIKNYVYDHKKDKVFLIDHECTSFNYVAFDLAQTFIEAGMKTLGIVSRDVSPATGGQIKHFVQCYIARRFGLKESDPQFENLVKTYFYQAKAFTILNCLYWSSMAQLPCLIEEEVWTNGDFDFRSVSRNFRKAYLQGREEMLRLLESLQQT